MKSTNLQIYNLLAADTALLALLANNAPITDPDGTATKTNSIVPSDMVTRKLNTPFITIQEGNEDISGHTLSQTFYVRCYNDSRKSYIEINEVLDRVREVLTSSDFSLTDRRFVKVTTESRLPGLEEEEMALKFKEERYRVEVL